MVNDIDGTVSRLKEPLCYAAEPLHVGRELCNPPATLFETWAETPPNGAVPVREDAHDFSRR